MSQVPLEYGPLAGALHDRAARIRRPINGAFELTSSCNLFCRMCYVRKSGCLRTDQRREMSTSQWLELARQAKDNGLLFLLLTGGEIFLRHDFFDIYEPLTRIGLLITLFTNGTRITPEIAERLAQNPPNRMEITLYGATEATYETVTGAPGSYAACCAGIEALVANRIPLGLKTTLTRYNVAELEAMRQMAHNWGLPFNGAWLLSQRPDGQLSEVDNCRLAAAECVELEATDRASATEMHEAALRQASPENPEKVENFYCKAGKATFTVNSHGDMNACLLLPAPGARPLEIGFKAAWDQVTRYVECASEPSSACVSCNMRAYCGRCPAWSLSETGTLNEPVAYWCEIARERKRRYGQAA
ncbi:MAG: radical SAM/SPASM domain-containing protein [Syntrophobacteraceae bacterium]